MTLTFNVELLEVVEVHVWANFYQANCRSSWVIVVMETNSAENNTAFASAGSNH